MMSEMPIEPDYAADNAAGSDTRPDDNPEAAVQTVQPPAEAADAAVGDDAIALPSVSVAPDVSPAAAAPAPGGNPAMRVFTRAQTDLAVQTEGKRPATREQIALAVHHAMVAEGLKPPSQPQIGTPAQPLPNLAPPSPAQGSPIVPGANAATVPMPVSGPPTALPLAATPSSAVPPGGAPPVVGPAPASAGGARGQHSKFREALKELIEAPAPRTPRHQRIMTVLTTQDPDRIGYLSSKYESPGAAPGTVSSGKNDPGGVSYGSYQLSYSKGTLQGFLASDDNLWARDFAGLKPKTAAFDKKWKEIAAQDPSLFRDAQFSYLRRVNYDSAVNAVKKATGVDLDAMPDSIRAAVFSMAVQHGKARIPLTNAVKAANASPGIGAPDYNEKLLHQLYLKRSDYVTSVAKATKNPGDKKTLLDLPKNRYPKEELDAFAAFLSGN